MKYITDAGEEEIRQFKYKGSNISLSYNNIWSPLADYLLKFVPTTWAPNSITVAGFLISGLGALSIAIQTPHSIPCIPWTLLFFSLCVFTYQTLDNIDGKQARKLGASSALGMMMDHGCDGLGLLFLSVGVGRICLVTHQVLYLWIYLLGVLFSFFSTAWCQYYSNGVLVLGKFNAVDDGIPVVWMIGIFSYFVGQEFWLTEVNLFGLDVRYNDFIIAFIFFAGIVQFWDVLASAGENFTKNKKQAYSDLAFVVCLSFGLYAVTFHSNLYHTHFIAIQISLTFAMARMITYALLCTVSKMKFQQFQPSIIAITFVYPLYTFFGQKYVNADIVMYVVMVFTMVEYFVFIYSIFRRIADILGIRIFHLKKQNK